MALTSIPTVKTQGGYSTPEEARRYAGNLIDVGATVVTSPIKLISGLTTGNWNPVDMGVSENVAGGNTVFSTRQTGGQAGSGGGTVTPKSEYNDIVDSGSASTGAIYGSGYSTADSIAQYNDAITQIDRLLGNIGVQRDAGLENLRNSLNSQKQRLQEQRQKTMAGYDQQSLENAKAKQQGIDQVDQYANQNYTSLQRLLQGSNAGASSVARELIPYLVSKSAGTRRANVFNTAGQNDQSIASARGTAEDEYNYAAEDLDNQARSQEQQFRQSILNQENSLLAEKQNAQMERARANGASYASALAAAQNTRNDINSRQDQLNALFSQFKPTYTTRAMNLKTPELSKYTVDRAQIESQNGNMPTESSYYLSQLRKKQQEQM